MLPFKKLKSKSLFEVWVKIDYIQSAPSIKIKG